MHIAICDDIPNEANATAKLLATYQQENPGVTLTPHVFYSSAQLLESQQHFDMYLLDIIMPGTDGIALAEQIRQQDKDVPLIFLTMSTSYALDAFRVYASQYILKPVTREALFAVLNKIIKPNNKPDSSLTVSAAGRIISLPLHSIVAAEHAKRVLNFHLENGDKIESKYIRTSFETAVEKLLKDIRFLWVHQSYVINMTHVQELRNRAFLMKNGMEISIPRAKYSVIKNAYLKYLSETEDTK